MPAAGAGHAPVEELHIASVVVHSTPRRVAAVQAAVLALAAHRPDPAAPPFEAEVHGGSAEGKLVVTLEAACAAGISAGVAALQHIDGVLSAALVYQCADSLDSMNEEMPDAQA